MYFIGHIGGQRSAVGGQIGQNSCQIKGVYVCEFAGLGFLMLTGAELKLLQEEDTITPYRTGAERFASPEGRAPHFNINKTNAGVSTPEFCPKKDKECSHILQSSGPVPLPRPV